MDLKYEKYNGCQGDSRLKVLSYVLAPVIVPQPISGPCLRTIFRCWSGRSSFHNSERSSPASQTPSNNVEFVRNLSLKAKQWDLDTKQEKA